MKPGDVVFIVLSGPQVVADIVTEIDGDRKIRTLGHGWQYTADWRLTMAEAQSRYMEHKTYEQMSIRRAIRSYHAQLKQVNAVIEAGPPAAPEGFEDEQRKLLASKYEKEYNQPKPKDGLKFADYYQTVPSVNGMPITTWANF